MVHARMLPTISMQADLRFRRQLLHLLRFLKRAAVMYTTVRYQPAGAAVTGLYPHPCSLPYMMIMQGRAPSAA